MKEKLSTTANQHRQKRPHYDLKNVNLFDNQAIPIKFPKIKKIK